MARLMTLDPTNYQPHAEMCWIGAILMDQLDATEASCAKALAMEPKDPNNHNNLGFLRFRQGRFEESIAAYSDSISGNPSVASSFLVRGLAKRALGQAGAEEDVSKGLELDPGVAARYASYGVIIAEAGAAPAGG
jgi:Tfp pilus assembly protein PilF